MRHHIVNVLGRQTCIRLALLEFFLNPLTLKWISSILLLLIQKHEIEATHLKRSLSGQTLINDGSNTPQVSFGIVVLRHDDFRCLFGREQKFVL